MVGAHIVWHTEDVATTAKTVRERARAELVAAIKASARRQLAASGATALSLRAIARELEMASSAIYRYFPSRDELLTALIIDAYDAVGEISERADEEHARDRPAARWLAVCRAIRAWAHANPHEYALVYGSPVPGYRAPADTVAHASRVALVLARVVLDGVARRGRPTGVGNDDIDRAFHDAALRELMANVSPEVVTRSLMAWTELFGLISMELFGHLVGSVIDNDAFFDRAIELMGRFVGLPDDRSIRVGTKGGR
jgi:AcrR family transcriptional regulator